ncbi:hypothetical protein EP7_002181 [Isosphaeraceae bacterium EP7]
MAIKLSKSRRDEAIRGTSAPSARRHRATGPPATSQKAALLDALSRGKERVRACQEAMISTADFCREFDADPEFRDDVFAAEMVPNEDVRESLYLLAMSGQNHAAAREFLNLRYRDLELQIMVERHEHEMRGVAHAPAASSSVGPILSEFVASIAEFIRPEGQADVLLQLAESLAKADAAAQAEAGRTSVSAALPSWARDHGGLGGDSWDD